MTVLNNTHNIGTEHSVYKKGSTINVNFEFLRNKKYLVVKAKDSTGKEKILNVGDDYSLDISDGLNGAYGVVTLLKTLDDPLSKISLSRSIPTTQEKNLSSRVIFSSDLEMSLDRLTLLIQDIIQHINEIGIVPRVSTKKDLGMVQIGENVDVDIQGIVSVATASNDRLGVVKIGDNLSIDADGRLKAYLLGDIYLDRITPIFLKLNVQSRSICYGDGKFVAGGGSVDGSVDGSNYGEYSADGIYWERMNSKNNLVCYGNGMFVSVRSSNVVCTNHAAYSYNGINWTNLTMSFEGILKSVCYGNGKFVAVGGSKINAYGAYSTDGINWEPMDIEFGGYWESVCYGIDKFVAVQSGNSDNGAYSYDGIHWKPMNMKSYRNWYSVCYGNGKFVAVGEFNQGAYSADGINWEPTEDMQFSGYWRSVCYGNGKFVAVMSFSFSGSYSVVAYSSDGIKWDRIIMPSNLNLSWCSVCYGSNKFVVVDDSNRGAIINCVPMNLSDVAVSGDYNDLNNKPVHFVLNPATTEVLGGVKVGENLSMTADGVMNAVDTTYERATTSSDGLMSSDDKRKVDNLSMVATSGSYNDLSNKPVIPDAQVRSDWTASSGISEILNKPALKPVATSGSYNDLSNKPVIPDAQVRSDWTASSGISEILNKPALKPVATTGSYNDLFNKLVGGENIRIDENNVVSYVGGVGEDLYKAGEHIKIEKAHNVEQCYKDSNSIVDILLHNDEHVTAAIYPNKLMLSDVSRQCAEWQEVFLPFEYSGYGVIRSNDKMYVVDKDNHIRVSRIDNLVTWIDDGKIPKEPWSYAFYTGAYGICEGKEHVVFYAIVNSDPGETAIAYYVDGVQRPLKVLPYRIIGMAFDGNKIYCVTDIVDILIYNAEFTNLLQTLTIPLTPLINIKYSNNRLLVLAWEGSEKKCLYASAYPYNSFEKVSDDFDKDSLWNIFVYKNTFSFVCDNKLYTSEDAFNWSHATLDKAYEFGIFLNKFSLVYDKSNYDLYKHMGGINTISATYEKATAEADGFMSKEDKIKLNAAMKFPDGEAGYTFPNAAGRADRVITFNSSGVMSLQRVWDYDNFRCVRINTSESLSGTNLELPTASTRANKVIGFGSDGKNVEMKDAGGGDITVGEGLRKNGDEISLKLADEGVLGGIIYNYSLDNPLRLSNGNLTLTTEEGLTTGYNGIALQNATESGNLGGIRVQGGEANPLHLDNLSFLSLHIGEGLAVNNGVLIATGGGGDEFVNEPVITGDMVSERIAFVDRGKQDIMPSCVASFVINGKKIFFIARGNYIYRSNDCISWYKTEKINNAYEIVSFLQSGKNILFATSLYDSPYGGEIFLSSDGGYSFTQKSISFQSFHGWYETQGYILICSYNGLYNSLNGGDTWSVVPNSIRDIFSSPVFFKGKFYFFRKTRELDEYSEIVSMTTLDYTFVTEHTFINNHIPLSLTVDDDYIYVVVKDGTGYPQSFIYSSYTGSNFTLTQTYNNMYERLLGRQNNWLLIDNNKNAWFCKNLSDNPLQVHFNCFGGASDFHYSKNTDLFVTHDMSLLVSTKAYHIGTDNMSSFAAKPLGEMEGIMSVGGESDIGSVTSDTE